jgi:hypothetical protein
MDSPNWNLLKGLPHLPAISFFSLKVGVSFLSEKVLQKRSRRVTVLPDMATFFPEESFAEVGMGWNEKGLYLQCDIRKAFEECFYPEYSRGDCLEFFIDTRNMKTAHLLHRFCHHFILLPQKMEGIQLQEIASLRSSEVRPPLSLESAIIVTEFQKKRYFMSVFMPLNCFFGYEPTECPHLGFAYRIHRYKGKPQNFCLSNESGNLEKNPSLWAHLDLLP